MCGRRKEAHPWSATDSLLSFLLSSLPLVPLPLNPSGVKLALEATRPADDQIDADDATNSVPGGYERRRQPQDSVATRIVAVVVHLDSSTGDEQAWFVHFSTFGLATAL